MRQLKSAYQSELHAARVAATERITQLDQDSAKIVYRRTQLELRARQDGVVKKLATTTVGAVVQPDKVLASLVPVRAPVIAEIAIDNQDIGFVRPGERVHMKLATFPLQKYGMLEGTVRTVMADSKAPTQGSTESNGSQGQLMSFKVLIALEGQTLVSNGSRWPLAAGRWGRVCS